MLSKEGEIRRDEACLDYAGQDVILYPCHGSKGNQFWNYHSEVGCCIFRKKNFIVNSSQNQFVVYRFNLRFLCLSCYKKSKWNTISSTKNLYYFKSRFVLLFFKHKIIFKIQLKIFDNSYPYKTIFLLSNFPRQFSQ